MPSSALRHVPVDHTTTLADIPRVLVELASRAIQLSRTA
jgi:hypothetical protein